MDYVFSVRGLRNGRFTNEPAASRFLAVPEAANDLDPDQKITKAKWVGQVIEAGKHDSDDVGRGDIVFYVHGFNNSTATVLSRHRALAKGLRANGFQGIVVSFDWPSADSALNYLEDRVDAKQTAFRLVDEGIRSFAALQRPDCRINLHIVAHSMGAFVVREAFDDADDRPAIAQTNWSVSQIMLIAADVSAGGMAEGSAKSSSLYRHCVRLTNYYNHFDDVLSLSNIKRVGVAPRAGRVGLPDDAPSKAVDIYCGKYFEDTRASQPAGPHSWYFDNPVMMTDLFHTIDGRIDRHDIPTRRRTNTGDLALAPPS
ncbi:alpha/beta hydrolase [Jannaschia pohangensis]|uniref:Esterase/lipase superfamily enzyme n=1 Tax=Jannaschia pohangensis TaxID=390807 RepID=A0A1I3GRY1_9RHOB|nr:alpha/beta hydrolase [Jannaschia pohangensis]SFI26183.1 Esterase/lipase superfamily enzyme [Jannaschia pohangensis]